MLLHSVQMDFVSSQRNGVMGQMTVGIIVMNNLNAVRDYGLWRAIAVTIVSFDVTDLDVTTNLVFIVSVEVVQVSTD